MLPRRIAPLPSYAELHCRSNCSFLTGTSHPEELVARAQALGYSALAMTDECSLGGVVRAHAEAEQLRLRGLEVDLILLSYKTAALCCNVLHQIRRSEAMAAQRGRKPSGKPRATRASASLPPELYVTLQEIAKQKKVSVAWVIRDAAEKYIAEQWPLFART